MPNIIPLGLTPPQGQAGEFLGTIQLDGENEGLQLAYRGRLLLMSNINPISLIVPTDAEVPFPNNSVVPFMQENIGKVTVVASNPGVVTIIAPENRLRTNTQFARGAVTKIANNEWLVSGNMEAVT